MWAECEVSEVFESQLAKSFSYISKTVWLRSFIISPFHHSGAPDSESLQSWKAIPSAEQFKSSGFIQKYTELLATLATKVNILVMDL